MDFGILPVLMFWQSVRLGIQSLSDWHILLGMFGIIVVMMIWRMSTAAVFGTGTSNARGAVGCMMMMAGVIIEPIAISFFILLCVPSLLGGSGFAPLDFIDKALPQVLWAALIAFVMVFVLTVIPVLGGLIEKAPGVTTFLQGIIIFRPVAQLVYEVDTNGRHLPNEAFPGFWLTAVYAVVGVLLVLALLFVLILIFERRDPRPFEPDPDFSPVGAMVGLVFGPVCGILPLLMYAKYVILYVRVHA